MNTTLKRSKSHPTLVRMASGQRVVSHSLADPEVADRMADLRARIKASPDLGLSLLKGAGILTATGRLSKKFGG